MKTAPVIIVQLIHIEGPLKGQIVELSDSEIKIGRHASCQLKYPADLNIISREHATITREGNRFKICDHSANGTIVNGKRIKKIFLKDGDVITVSEGGPKVSFLTKMCESPPAQQAQEPAPSPQKNIVSPSRVEKPRPPEPSTFADSSQTIAPPLKNKMPLIVQYGPTLRSFEKLPLKIGKHSSNDFFLDHTSILDLHAEIYFADGNYYIRDLTGQQMVTINGVSVEQGAILQKDDELALSQSGPFFQFLGNGRLGEVEKKHEDVTGNEHQPGNNVTERSADNKSKPMSFLKKIFSKVNS